MNGGYFCMSLDYEMSWGILEQNNLRDYQLSNISNCDFVIEHILDLFDKYAMRSTWGIVGALTLNNESEFLSVSNIANISYDNVGLSPYLHKILDEKYYFSHNTLDKIKSYQGQEIASHTFAHFYCKERGQLQKEFEIDLALFEDVIGFKVDSIIFPRNQVNTSYLMSCKNVGIHCYRGVIDKFSVSSKYVLKVLNYLDCFINIRSFNTYSIDSIIRGKQEYGMLDIKGSRFLRPVFRSKILMYLHMRRIKSEMTHAAKNGEIYHLWWHPHNFGSEPEVALSFLEEIILHFKVLQDEYQFQSVSMNDFIDLVEKSS
ncbi:hypothetical protein AB4527_18585 [Vibrio breoganii]